MILGYNFRLPHVILIALIGIFTGAITTSNMGGYMGWVEYTRIIGCNGFLYGIIFLIAYRNGKRNKPSLGNDNHE